MWNLQSEFSRDFFNFRPIAAPKVPPGAARTPRTPLDTPLLRIFRLASKAQS